MGLKSRASSECLKRIRDYYTHMQCEYSPLVKLKYVLFIVNDLLNEFAEFESAMFDFGSLSASSLLPQVIYAISKCGMYAFQIELEYIWSLANRQLLTLETLYYLTLMSSACNILKSMETTASLHNDNYLTYLETASINNMSMSSSNINSYLNAGLLHVYLPDDKYQTLRCRCVPIKPSSKVKEIGQMLSAKFKLFNSGNHDEYELFYMENGREFKLRDDERPFEVKKAREAPMMKFIFRQRNAKFLWPKSLDTFS